MNVDFSFIEDQIGPLYKEIDSIKQERAKENVARTLFLKTVRQALLLLVDALEKELKFTLTTADLRRLVKSGKQTKDLDNLREM